MVVPSATVFDNAGSLIENLEFIQYEQQDAVISTWLLSTVSSVLHNRFIGDSISASVLWSAVNKIFGSQSTTKH